jgi:1,4-dihydroxy-2-naphthoate octaprenyltransferase
MFNKFWMKTSGVTEDDLQKGHPGKVFGLAYLFSFVMAAVLYATLGDSASVSMGARIGFTLGLGFICMALGIVYQFERRSFGLLAVNGGYWLVSLTTMGAIIGAWQ